MSRFPSVTGTQLIKALVALGFEVIRIKGSHYFLRHPADQRCTVYPFTVVKPLEGGCLRRF